MKQTGDALNMDLMQRVVIDTSAQEWIGSRAEQVLRKPLEREHAESGRATSLVKFLPGASFPPHRHGMGEEIFVLEGTFSDEYGDYPAGTYLRNPPGSIHSPRCDEGCVIFVKLEQFDVDDTQRKVIDTHTLPKSPGLGNLEVKSLHSFRTSHTALVYWPAGEQFQPHQHWSGEEILVLEGEFIDEHGRYPKGTWIRSPHLSSHNPYVEVDTVILVKVGHLPPAEE